MSLFAQLVLILKKNLSPQIYDYVRNIYRICRDAVLSTFVVKKMRGMLYRKDYWVDLWLQSIFSTEWVEKWRWKKESQRLENRFWDGMLRHYNEASFVLSDEERCNIEKYENRFSCINVYFVENNCSIASLCLNYFYWMTEPKGGDICKIIYFENALESKNVVANYFLAQRLKTRFEEITKETFSFWYAYLKRNRKSVVVKSIYDSMFQQRNTIWNYWRRRGKPFRNNLIAFSSEEQKCGESALNAMGIHYPYVCIFARDARYNNEMRHVSEMKEDLRNFDINTFKTMTQYFWQENTLSVRMGALVEREYRCDGAIDYANLGRTDFLDFFIFANCRFWVGSNSGICYIGHLLNISWVCINNECPFSSTNIIDVTSFPDIIIYKKFYSPEKERFLRLREIAALQIYYYIHCRKPVSSVGAGYDAFILERYDVISNTPDEILDAAKEMEAILNHTIQYTDHDQELQQRYRSIIESFHERYPTIAMPVFGRLGMQWIRDNEWFLE